jgi:hypothetical protein
MRKKSLNFHMRAILSWYVIILISDYDYDGGGSIAAVRVASGI